jgi:dTDP-4-amino-4,6-dideoxygalactose transaminase
VGTPRVLALSSGTGALELAMRLAGVGPGDDVITTPLTCVATNHAILHAGARVVWSDVDPSTGNVDPSDVARKVSARTRAIVVVHWGGDPCDLDAVADVAARRGVPVIEDAGHAFGALHGGRPVGARSDFVCFSFQAVKVLTTVDGGALCCGRPEDLERGRLLRWYGIDRARRRARGIDDDTGDILEAGYKLHMNDVTAAIGLEQLRHVSGNLARARAHAAAYDRAFAGLPGVKPAAASRFGESSRWLYTLLAGEPARLRAHLAARGIEASRVHVRNDRYTVFRPFATPLPGLDAFTARHLCIPVGWWLRDDDVARVIDAVLEVEGRSDPRGAPATTALAATGGAS